MADRKERVELKGSGRADLPGGKDVGPADPNQRIEVSVLLRRGSAPAAEHVPANSRPRKRWEPGCRESENISRAKNLRARTALRQPTSKKFARLPPATICKWSARIAPARIVKLAGTVEAFNVAFGVTYAATITARARFAAAPARSRFLPISTESSKAFSGSTIARKPKRISGCAKKSQRARARRRMFLTRRCKWRKPTSFPSERTVPASASP